jgi:hypothetical protein
VRNPTGHHLRNITSDARGDPDQLVTVIARDLEAAVDDIRRRATRLDGEPQTLLNDVADALVKHVAALRLG